MKWVLRLASFREGREQGGTSKLGAKLAHLAEALKTPR